MNQTFSFNLVIYRRPDSNSDASTNNDDVCTQRIDIILSELKTHTNHTAVQI